MLGVLVSSYLWTKLYISAPFALSLFLCSYGYNAIVALETIAIFRFRQRCCYETTVEPFESLDYIMKLAHVPLFISYVAFIYSP